MADLVALLADLSAEGQQLDDAVAMLPADAWATPTPAQGWTIATQIAHLSWTDAVALTAATDATAFAEQLQRAIADPLGYVDAGAHELARLPPAELLTRWRDGRAALVDALVQRPPGQKLPWFGPAMGTASMATARLMETWAHGEDVAAALRLAREPTDRLRHVAHLGVRTRDFAFLLHDVTPPVDEFRVELTGPQCESWTWGPDAASERVCGPALDFCLLVTQRKHRDDLALTTVGEQAAHWLEIAQAFAGPPGPGRKPAGE